MRRCGKTIWAESAEPRLSEDTDLSLICALWLSWNLLLLSLFHLRLPSTLFPLCHPAEREEIHLTLKNIQKNLKIRFSATTKVSDFYQHLEHTCRGLKGFLEMADEENNIQKVTITWQKPRVTWDEKEAVNLPVCYSGLQPVPVRPILLIRASAKCLGCIQCMENSEGHPRESSLQGPRRRVLTILTLTALCHIRLMWRSLSYVKAYIYVIVSDPCPFWCRWATARWRGMGWKASLNPRTNFSPCCTFLSHELYISSFCILSTPACVPWLPGSWGPVRFPSLCRTPLLSLLGLKEVPSEQALSLSGEHSLAGLSFCCPL